MSFEFAIRLIGMFVIAIAGLRLGVTMADLAGDPPEIWALVLGLVGALFGLILTPYFTTRPARVIRERLNELPAQQLVAVVGGLIIGLIVAALLSLPLSLLPNPYSALLPVGVAIACAYFGVSIFSMRRRDIFDLFRGQFPIQLSGLEDGGLTSSRQILLDTSVIIDGRIADIAQAGFIMGPMLIPRIVLNELHHIADSPDALRRNRGRRGIDILNRMQKESLVPVRITDMDIDSVEAVDEKLIMLARQLGCAIVTNDYNLNRVAELQGVLVLNVNDLANAVKSVFLPGEELNIQVIQEGRELGQGVGYLEDGTMVVVEGGKHHVDARIDVIVTKVLQTSAGRMIFAKPSSIA